MRSQEDKDSAWQSRVPRHAPARPHRRRGRLRPRRLRPGLRPGATHAPASRARLRPALHHARPGGRPSHVRPPRRHERRGGRRTRTHGGDPSPSHEGIHGRPARRCARPPGTVGMSARHSIEATPITPGDGARDQLLALGVPDHDAQLWAMMGPAVSATLWTYRDHALLETHRATSAHRTISGTYLLHEAATTTENDTHTPRWETLIQAIIDSVPNAPLIKAVSRETNSHWEAALRSRGFTPAGLVGSPLSIEEHFGHGHAHVRAWLRWNGPGVSIPAYVRQKPSSHADLRAPSWPSRTPALPLPPRSATASSKRWSCGARPRIRSGWDLRAGVLPGQARSGGRGSRDTRRSRRWADACACCVACCAPGDPRPTCGRSTRPRGA